MPKKRIVIFEPYDGLRESLKLILDDDYDLLFATSFEEALREVGGSGTGLFILDVGGDQDSAFKMIEQAKKQFPDGKILVTSVNMDWAFKEKILKTVKTGIRFCDKPFQAKELKQQVDVIINGDPDWRRSVLRVRLN